jgi:hypothetical protein
MPVAVPPDAPSETPSQSRVGNDGRHPAKGDAIDQVANQPVIATQLHLIECPHLGNPVTAAKAIVTFCSRRTLMVAAPADA